MLNVQKLVVESFTVNKENGWHEEGRTFEEIGALIASEIAEALEDFRNGHAPTEEWYTSKHSARRADKQEGPEWKPEGIPSELADVIIRIADAAGLYGWGGALETDVEEIREMGIGACAIYVMPGEFGTSTGKLFALIGQAIAEQGSEMRIWKLASLWGNVEALAEFHGIDLERAINEKLAHNRTRGYKHGGKVI